MKRLLPAVFLLLSAGTIQAQSSALIPDILDISTPEMHPLNAGSSTLQKRSFLGISCNMYVHCWDGLFQGQIAWRRTGPTGLLINSGIRSLPYVQDLDVALYEYGSGFYVLAAYYYSHGSTKGHFYNVYELRDTGLTIISSMVPLSSSPTPGRINVDANKNGMAISWGVPGTGIFVCAGTNPLTTLHPPVLIPATTLFKDPDLCINESSSTITIQLAYLSNAGNEIRELRVPLSSILAVSSAGMIMEYATTASGSNQFSAPRVDCSDVYGPYKWTVVFSEFNVTGGTVTETIRAAVRNSAFSASPTDVTVHSTSYVQTSSLEPNGPVVTYNKTGDSVIVGWMTKAPTTLIPGTTQTKFVSKYIRDNGTMPTMIPGSYRMISNSDGGSTHAVLAFSNQNIMSDFDGMHTVCSQRFPSPLPVTYKLYYKNVRWAGAFRLTDGDDAPTIKPEAFPNPFNDQLSLRLPLQGDYRIGIWNIEGRPVYRQSVRTQGAELLQINTERLPPGSYLLQLSAPELTTDFRYTLIK